MTLRPISTFGRVLATVSAVVFFGFTSIQFFQFVAIGGLQEVATVAIAISNAKDTVLYQEASGSLSWRAKSTVAPMDTARYKWRVLKLDAGGAVSYLFQNCRSRKFLYESYSVFSANTISTGTVDTNSTSVGTDFQWTFSKGGLGAVQPSQMRTRYNNSHCFRSMSSGSKIAPPECTTPAGMADPDWELFLDINP